MARFEISFRMRGLDIKASVDIRRVCPSTDALQTCSVCHKEVKPFHEVVVDVTGVTINDNRSRWSIYRCINPTSPARDAIDAHIKSLCMNGAAECEHCFFGGQTDEQITLDADQGFRDFLDTNIDEITTDDGRYIDHDDEDSPLSDVIASNIKKCGGEVNHCGFVD